MDEKVKRSEKDWFWPGPSQPVFFETACLHHGLISDAQTISITWLGESLLTDGIGLEESGIVWHAAGGEGRKL